MLTTDRFRWVQCQIDSLEHCVDTIQIDEVLESLPKDLPATYERILTKLDQRSAARVRQVLASLAFSRRPLRVTEILDMLAVSTQGPPYIRKDGRVFLSTLLAACGSLVVMSSGGQRELRLAHASVKDYLLSEDIRRGPAKEFAFSNEDGRENRPGHRTGCLLHHDDVGAFGPPTLEQHPFTLYAALNWHFHAQDANDAEERGLLDDLIFELFHVNEGAYINWHRICGGSGPDHPVEGFAWGKHLVDSKPASLKECLRRQAINQPLLHATEWDMWRIVERLLDAGHDPNVFSSGNYAPMHGGVHRRAFRSMELLLRRGAHIDIGDWLMASPLVQCVFWKQDALAIEWLLARGADASRGTPVAGSVLECAAVKGRADLVELVLDKSNADPNQVYLYTYNEAMRLATALQCAAYVGSIPCMEVLIRHGADVRQVAGDTGTALDAAAAGGRVEAARWLLDQGGGELNRPDGRAYINVLMAAGHGVSRDCVAFFLDRGADLGIFRLPQGRRTWAELDGAERTILIDTIIWVSVVTCCRNITEAASRGLTSRVAFLLENAANRHATLELCPPISGRTPVHCAALAGHVDTVIFLAGQGANLEATTRDVETPLEQACMAGNLEMVKCLLAVGCRAGFRNPGKHRTAWVGAQMSGNAELVRFLRSQKEADGVREFEFRGKTYVFDGKKRYKVKE